MKHAVPVCLLLLLECFPEAFATAGPPCTPASPSGYDVYTATYIGHATVLLRLNEVTVLTDPLYVDRVGPYRRHQAPGVLLEDLPSLDVILISHAHWDHFSKSTLRRLAKRAVVVVPDGLERQVEALGFADVRGLEPGESTTVRGATITAVPVRHFGTATAYVIQNGRTVYFAGDTGFFQSMRTAGQPESIDLALLPIGGYRPHLWFIPGLSRAMRRVHMAPEDIPDAVARLGARLVVPIHWGTFKLTGEPIDEPLARLRRVVEEKKLGETIRVVNHGETIGF